MRESLDNLRLCGVITYLDCHCEGQADVGQIIAAYDLFEDVTEKLLGQLSAMVVTAEYADGTLRMRIQVGCREAVAALPAFSIADGKVSCDAQDEDLIIEATLTQGGAKA